MVHFLVSDSRLLHHFLFETDLKIRIQRARIHSIFYKSCAAVVCEGVCSALAPLLAVGNEQLQICKIPIIMLFSKIDNAEATHVSVQCYTLESITEPYEDGQPRGPPAASEVEGPAALSSAPMEDTLLSSCSSVSAKG